MIDCVWDDGFKRRGIRAFLVCLVSCGARRCILAMYGMDSMAGGFCNGKKWFDPVHASDFFNGLGGVGSGTIGVCSAV